MGRIVSIIKGIVLKCWLCCIDSKAFVKWLRKHGITVGENVNFRYPSHTTIDLTRPSLIEFGSNIDINDHFTVLTHDFSTYVLRGKYHDFINSSGKVKIGNNVVIGRNVSILKGVEIGDNTIIALGSVVTKSVPPNSVIAGMPARVVCTLDEYYEKRKQKQLGEAVEYAESILSIQGRTPRIEDFSEEWCLFLTKEEYLSNPIIKQKVDFRLNGYVDVDDFITHEKPFKGYDNFLQYVKEHDKRNK